MVLASINLKTLTIETVLVSEPFLNGEPINYIYKHLKNRLPSGADLTPTLENYTKICTGVRSTKNSLVLGLAPTSYPMPSR